MLKRVSALILSAATFAACSEPTTTPAGRTQLPSSGRQLLAELTCKADVAAQRITCTPAAPSLAGGASPNLIIGGQDTYVRLTSTSVVKTGTVSLTGDVTVKNLTVQPWATTDGTTASPTGVRVFFVTLPDQGVTINNADGTGTFTASNQPYYEYSAAALGADGILSSNEVSSIKTWKFDLNGATGAFSFQVYVTTQLPDEPGVLRWTPTSVAATGSFETIQAIWGSGPSDVWVGGTNGNSRFHHWDGTSWTYTSGVNSSVDVVGMWGTASSNVYAVGGAKIERYDGTIWNDVTSGSTSPLFAVWGSSASDIYAGGLNGTLVHSTGGAFSSVSSTGIGTEAITAIWGSSSSDVYVGTALVPVGGSNVYHYNGSTWSPVSVGLTQSDNVNAIWGSSSSDVWLGCTGGQMVHFNGSTWSAPITLGSADVGGIWGTSSSDIYMVNRGGEIWHYNGTSWVSYTVPASAFLAVWGSGRTNVWAVGTDDGFEFNRAYNGTR